VSRGLPSGGRHDGLGRCRGAACGYQAHEAVYRRLAQVDANAIDAIVEEEDGSIPYRRFSADAQEAFDGWRADLEHFLGRGDEHPAIVAHLAKYRSLVPSLALIIYLADGGTGAVGLVALERACAWSEYLASHARRIYGRGLADDAVSARALAEKIRSGALPARFRLRDVCRPQWSGLATREEVARAIALLADAEWIRVTAVETGGARHTSIR